jgi:uncharacterized protein (TIGR03083 family)
MVSAFRSASDRFLAQLGRVDDPTRTAIGYWDIGSLTAHVGHIVDMYPGIVRGEGTPVENHRKVSEHWDKKVSDDPERDLGILAKRIEVGRDAFHEALETADWQKDVKWLGGLTVPVWSLPGILLNEFSIHGFDIANAIGAKWDIPSEHARLVIAAHTPFLHGFINEEVTRDLTAAYALHVRGGVTYYLSFRNGRFSIGDTKIPVDCHISIDPVSYLLIGYGRKSQWPVIATGKTLTWGRKPWLAFSFAKLFQNV